ncbi:hypothetical protein FRB94_006868 [Tulasnella sp. JGI-2019a]|nr:hypothetical protein FRB94_006868 [Tulasnella sp. JGI-2019a]KAG9017786.1 hypothetical protein FRB93_004597 [Tulasnella sp. JGI-2019a]KAG9035854.1 hypothetical protein FRB95_010448 [Tulasnella sp. JGI-2019a]
MSQLTTGFYNLLVRRNSVYVPAIFMGAFAFGISFDLATNSLWDTWNKGKQWKDIRSKYVEAAE